jgi:hypothetical protein
MPQTALSPGIHYSLQILRKASFQTNRKVQIPPLFAISAHLLLLVTFKTIGA